MEDLEATEMLELEKKAFYSPTEFANIASVDPSTVLDWIHRDELYAVKLGPKTYRIPLAVVLRRLSPEPPKPTRVVIDPRELEADERRRSRRRVAAMR